MKQFFNRQFFYTSVLTVVLSALAFILLKADFIGYSYTLFIITPVSIGYFIGQRPGWKINLMFALIFGAVFFLFLLVASALEFFSCIVMLFPLIIVVMFIGTAVGYWLRQKVEKNKNRNIKLTAWPLLILLLSTISEHYFVGKYDYVTVSTKIYLPYSTIRVYDYIKSVDTLNTTKPFLLNLGLPVPKKCVLEKEVVGANRTCYFEDGAIDEKVTAIKPGAYLKMEVTKCTVPLPKWLKLNEANYLFEEKDSGTALTRITTYRTELKPRFYWRYWEVKAIEAEHEYVLNDLGRRLDGK